MTPVLGRREQRFAELVDEATGRHRRTDLDPELAPLTVLAMGLRSGYRAPSAREEYRLGLRAMLLATIDREGMGATAVIPAQRTRTAKSSAPTDPHARRRRTRFAVLIGVTGALALSGVSQASVNALPGDPLYSVKRSAERAQLALAANDVARGKLLFDYANTRLQEARQVGPDLQPTVLAEMNTQSIEGFRLLAGEAVQRKSQIVMRMLDDLVQQWQDGIAAVHAAEPIEWQMSVNTVDAENRRLTQLRLVVRGECQVASVPDQYGPVPTNCTSSTSSEAGG